MGKNKFLVEFDDGNKRDIGYFLLVQVCSPCIQPHPKPTVILPVIKNTEYMKDEKRSKTKIVAGSTMAAKLGHTGRIPGRE